MKEIIIASRDSKLALWQTKFVKDKIEREINIPCKINTMKTKGDIIIDKPLNKVGGKSLFMKELEVSIQNNKAHIAVHSLKDVPYELPKSFCLTSFMSREDPRDAFISNNYNCINEFPLGSVIGTSSLRRKAQLLNYRKDLIIKDLRGNVQTRLAKLDSGKYDAIILASAGLIRLGLQNRIKQFIPTEISLPAVGQGVIVIEALKKDKHLCKVLQKINCLNSYLVSHTEREFNKEFKGGCHMAIGAYARIIDKKINLTAMVANKNGNSILRHSIYGSNPSKLGKKLAQKMIELGAYKILEG